MNATFHIADPVNGVLWMLLGLVGFVFAVAVWTAFYLWRRASTPIPPHIQFVESLTNEPEEC